MNPSIAVRELTKVYDLGEIKVRALRGVSLDIEAGEFVAVIGPLGVREVDVHAHPWLSGPADHGSVSAGRA